MKTKPDQVRAVVLNPFLVPAGEGVPLVPAGTVTTTGIVVMVEEMAMAVTGRKTNRKSLNPQPEKKAKKT